MVESPVANVTQLLVQRLGFSVVDTGRKADSAGARRFRQTSGRRHQGPGDTSTACIRLDIEIVQDPDLAEFHGVKTGIELDEADGPVSDLGEEYHRLLGLQSDTQKLLGGRRLRLTLIETKIGMEQRCQARKVSLARPTNPQPGSQLTAPQSAPKPLPVRLPWQ